VGPQLAETAFVGKLLDEDGLDSVVHMVEPIQLGGKED
jgi:hypothetical protein